MVFMLVQGTTGFLAAIGVAAVAASVFVAFLRRVIATSD
jgi:hypothetical protein